MIDAIDMRWIAGLQGDHDTIAYGRRIAVKGFGDADAGCPARLAPSNETLGLHKSADAEFAGQRIIKAGGFGEIVGS